MKRDDVGFPELHVQMRITNRLLAAQLRVSMRQVDLVRLLGSTGATNTEIADVLGTTPATVKTTLQRIRKSEDATGVAVENDRISTSGDPAQ
jgi:DNA-binding CsgD family transcriptional regulator